jgi:hypothetical protein
MKKLFYCFIFAIIAVMAKAQTPVMGSGTDSSGWAISGLVTTHTDTVAFDVDGKPYTITPAAGNFLFQIRASGALLGPNGLETALGLSAGSLSDPRLELITNFSFVSRTFNLSPGTYSFAWAMASTDYAPFNDGSLFALVGAGSQQLISLARGGLGGEDIGGPSADTLVLGDYGSTSWKTTQFSVVTGGDYQISFAAYNWGDTSLDPILFVSAVPGSFTGVEVSFSSPAPIPEPSTYALIGGVAALGLAWLRRRRPTTA